MVAPVPAERDLAALVTVGIKHTSAFPRRRAMLGVLLASIRARYGDSLRILVADDGRSAHKPTLQRHGARRIVLPRDSGLSHGRNELVRAPRTTSCCKTAWITSDGSSSGLFGSAYSSSYATLNIGTSVISPLARE